MRRPTGSRCFSGCKFGGWSHECGYDRAYPHVASAGPGIQSRDDPGSRGRAWNEK